MNQLGQAFSTFKLLIAAVVAIVILTILMQIVGVIPSIGTSDPPKAAADLVQELSGKYAYEKSTSEIEFKYQDSINRRGVAESTKGAVSEDRVCIFAGDFKDDSNWDEDPEGKAITYNGTTPQKAKLVGICDTGKDLLNTITDYGKAINAEWVEGAGGAANPACGCAGQEPENVQICCVLAVKVAV